MPKCWQYDALRHHGQCETDVTATYNNRERDTYEKRRTGRSDEPIVDVVPPNGPNPLFRRLTPQDVTAIKQADLSADRRIA